MRYQSTNKSSELNIYIKPQTQTLLSQIMFFIRMKYLVIFVFTLLTSVTSKSSSCDCGKFKAQVSFDGTKAVGDWFLYQRYPNGAAQVDSVRQYATFYPNGTALRTIKYEDKPDALVITNVVDSVNGSGELIFKIIPPTNPTRIFVTFTDYINILVIRACYKDEGIFLTIIFKTVKLIVHCLSEFVDIFSRKENPSKKTKKLIKEVINNEDLDRAKLVKMLN